MSSPKHPPAPSPFPPPAHRVRFLLGGRHGDFKFLPPPGYAPCFEALLPRERMRVEPIKEYKYDLDGLRNLLGPIQSLSHTAFTPCPVDTVQVPRGAQPCLACRGWEGWGPPSMAGVGWGGLWGTDAAAAVVGRGGGL